MTERKLVVVTLAHIEHLRTYRSIDGVEVTYQRKVYTFWNTLKEGYTLNDVPESEHWLFLEPVREMQGTGDDRFDREKVKDVLDELNKRRVRQGMTSDPVVPELEVRVHVLYASKPEHVDL